MLWISGSTGLKSAPTADVGNIFSSGYDSTENRKKKERKKKQTTLPTAPPELLVGHKRVCERLQLDNRAQTQLQIMDVLQSPPVTLAKLPVCVLGSYTFQPSPIHPAELCWKRFANKTEHKHAKNVTVIR